MPEKKRVVVGGKPVIIGTRKVAPNIAAMCWRPTPKVRGQVRRSSVETTAPWDIDFPSPCSFHVSRDIYRPIPKGPSAVMSADKMVGRSGGLLRRTPHLWPPELR